MKSKRLNAIVATKAFTFDDILTVMNEVCYEKLSKVIGSKDYTAEELAEKLNEQGWDVEYRFFTGKADSHTIHFSCWVQVGLGEVEGLRIGFSRRVMSQLAGGDISLIGFSEGEVFFENDPCYGFKIATLGELYSIIPESFNPKCFCDC